MGTNHVWQNKICTYLGSVGRPFQEEIEYFLSYVSLYVKEDRSDLIFFTTLVKVSPKS